MCDYQESVTTGQTDRQTPDKVIPMCCYALQATQKSTINPHICLEIGMTLTLDIFAHGHMYKADKDIYL